MIRSTNKTASQADAIHRYSFVQLCSAVLMLFARGSHIEATPNLAKRKSWIKQHLRHSSRVQ